MDCLFIYGRRVTIYLPEMNPTASVGMRGALKSKLPTRLAWICIPATGIWGCLISREVSGTVDYISPYLLSISTLIILVLCAFKTFVMLVKRSVTLLTLFTAVLAVYVL
jgi:hypothetical protein